MYRSVRVARQAFQLIRAVSVLLNFSREEEDMLKQTLEYKVGGQSATCVPAQR